GTFVQLHAELLDHTTGLRPEEAHSEQDQLCRDLTLGARDLGEACGALGDLDQMQCPDPAELVAQYLFGVHRVDTLSTLFMSARDSKERGVSRPRLGRGSLLPRAGHDLERRHRPSPLSVCGAD